MFIDIQWTLHTIIIFRVMTCIFLCIHFCTMNYVNAWMTCRIITWQGQDINVAIWICIYNVIHELYFWCIQSLSTLCTGSCFVPLCSLCGFCFLSLYHRWLHLPSILCILGGSSGTAAYVAMQACKDFGLTKDQRCVVLLPDSIRNYMSVDFVKIILQIYKSLLTLTLRNDEWNYEFFSQPPSSLFKNDYHVNDIIQ